MKTGKQLLNELRAQGAPTPKKPGLVRSGIFVLSGTYPDNSTTAVDLTLAAAITDQTLARDLDYTADNTDVVLLIKRIKCELDIGQAETAAIVGAAVRRTELHFKAGIDERSIMLGQAIGTVINQAVSSSDSTASTATLHSIRKAEWIELAEPLAVAMGQDTLELLTRTAVNVVGAVVFLLHVDGHAWRGTRDSIPQLDLSCVDDALAKKLGTARGLAFVEQV